MATLLDRNSAPAGKAELNLFSTPPTQVAIQHSGYVEFRPRNPIDVQPIRFEIPPNPAFIDVSHNRLFCRFKVTRADDTDIDTNPGAANAPAQDFAGPINYLGNTWIKHMKIYEGSRLLWDSGQDYAYKCIIEVLLGATTEAKKTHLRSALFAEDTGGEMAHVVNNVGLVARERATTNAAHHAAEFETISALHVDCWAQEKLWPNRMSLALEIYRNPDAFVFISDRVVAAYPQGAYKLKLIDCKLLVRMVETTPSLTLAFEKQLLRSVVKIPIRRAELSVIHLANNRADLPQQHIYTGQIPRRIIIAMVEHQTYYGSYATNPFNFQHFDLQSIQLIVAGKPHPPMPLEMNIDNKQYMEVYHRLYDNMGSGALDENGCGITFDQFINGYFLLVFDLSPDSSASSGYFQLVAEGAIELKMRFRQPIQPANGIKLLIYKEFDSILSIDRFRNCTMDYSV